MDFLYRIPSHLIEAYQSGAVRLIGATLRDTVTGQILGHVQQTGALDNVLANAAGKAMSFAGTAFPSLGLAMKAGRILLDIQQDRQLTEIQQALSLLQGLQVASLAISGLDLGVSAVGFAIVLKKLNVIEGRLKVIGDQIDKVTADRRKDEIGKIFVEIRRSLGEIDGLSHYKKPGFSASLVRDRLLARASDLEFYYIQRLEGTEGRGLSLEDLDYLWTLAGAMALCHDAAANALFELDELDAARKICLQHAHGFLNISGRETVDGLARLFAAEAKTVDEFSERYSEANPYAEKLVSGLRDFALAMVSRAELADTLIARSISGPQYMAMVRAEKEQPLLFLPAE